MIVPYTRFLSLLINGLDKTYRSNLSYVEDNLEFSFAEYVLSQMHLAIICHLLKRDLYVIHRVFRFLEESREVEQKDLVTVLQWFYRDMSNFFRNISRCDLLHNIELRVTVPEGVLSSRGIEAMEISFSAEKTKVMSALKEGEGKYEKYLKLHYKDVLDLQVGSLFNNVEQENRYVMAVILSYVSEQGKFVRWCGNDGCTDPVGRGHS